MQKLYDYIRERGTILPINDYNKELLMQDDVHKRVAESIRSGECNVCTLLHGSCLPAFGFLTPALVIVWQALPLCNCSFSHWTAVVTLHGDS